MEREFKDFNCVLEVNGDELNFIFSFCNETFNRRNKRKLKSMGFDFNIVSGLQKKLIPHIKCLEAFVKPNKEN